MHIYIYTETCYKELAHTTMEAEKFKICNWQARDPRQPMMHLQSKTGGLRTRRGDGASPSLRAGEDEYSGSGVRPAKFLLLGVFLLLRSSID